MAEQDFCHTCIHKHSCQTVYQHLGNAEGPSVGTKVFLAFLLPLIVFIVSLAVSEHVLAGALSSTAAQTAGSLLLALGVTLACIVITKVATKRAGHNR